jgi:hypothetical protein
MKGQFHRMEVIFMKNEKTELQAAWDGFILEIARVLRLDKLLNWYISKMDKK